MRLRRGKFATRDTILANTDKHNTAGHRMVAGPTVSNQWAAGRRPEEDGFLHWTPVWSPHLGNWSEHRPVHEEEKITVPLGGGGFSVFDSILGQILDNSHRSERCVRTPPCYIKYTFSKL